MSKKKEALAKRREAYSTKQRKRRLAQAHFRRMHGESNPKISPAVWVVGACALAGAGYLTYRYFKTHFTVAASMAYGVPAGAAITLTAPAGATWTGLTASDGSQVQVAVGQTTPLTFTASATTGVTYTVAWTLNNVPATATITTQ